MSTFTGRLGIAAAELGNIIVGADVTQFGGTTDNDILSIGDSSSVSLVRIQLPLTAIMSDDTTPLGVASSSPLFVDGVNQAFRAFDGLNDSTHLTNLSASFSPASWWAYQFPQPQKVECFALWALDDGDLTTLDQTPRNFQLQASSDGTNWTTLAAVTGAVGWSLGQKRVYGVNNPNWYTHYRLWVTANNGNPDQVALGELFLYGPPNMVPILSSNTLPFGVASSSDAASTAYKAFNNNYNTGGISTIAAVPTTLAPVWWQYQFVNPTTIASFAIWAPFDGSNANQMPMAFALQGSNDGSTWATLTNAIATESNWHAGERRAYPLAIPATYNYYRLNVTANNGGSATTIGELYLMAEAVPATLSNRTDHLTLGHASSILVNRTAHVTDSVVLTDSPYHTQSGPWAITPDGTDQVFATDAILRGYSHPEGEGDTLAVTDTARWKRTRLGAATQALTVGQHANVSLVKRVVDHVTITDMARTTHTTRVGVVDHVTLVANSTGSDSTKHLGVVDALALGDMPHGHDTAQRASVSDHLTLTDGTALHNTGIRPGVVDTLNLSDRGALAYHSPKHVDATDALTLSDTTSMPRPIYAGVVDTLQVTAPIYDSATGLWLTYGLQDTATAVDQHAGQSQNDRLYFGETGSVFHIRPSHVYACAAGDTLNLDDDTTTPHVADDALTLGDMASVDLIGPNATTDVLNIGQAASYKIVRQLGAQDTLVIEQSFLYILPYELARLEYAPFIGHGTSGNPPPPPAALPLPALKPGEFTLFYPPYPAAPIDVLVLRKPEFGNKDRLKFNRISRETRGGTLVIFADPMWPKTQNLVLTFSALRPDQAFGLQDFLGRHLGMPIGMMDWEGRQWSGVVVNPNEPVVQDSKYSFTGSLEFEGQLVTDMLATTPGTGYGSVPGTGYITPSFAH